jgi:DNA-binding transcriptional regulator YhcF (GntR family)
MLLYVDLTDGRPVYQQLRDQVVEGIATGAIAEGERLPTIRQLAADLAINFHTVARAYDLLRQEGFVQVGRRNGASICVRGEAASPEWRAALRTTLAHAYAKGMASEEILRICREILATFQKGGTSSETTLA